jgi:ankyrin repeat protein
VLLAHEASVNVRDKNGQTPLHGSVTRPLAFEIMELLLANDADVNAKDNNGQTPLHLAAICGYKQVSTALLARRADVNAKNNSDKTPLGEVKRKLAEEWSGFQRTDHYDYKGVQDLLRKHGAKE